MESGKETEESKKLEIGEGGKFMWRYGESVYHE